MDNYYEWVGFSNVYLEDSFVTQISEVNTELIFDMEFVLTEGHPFFEQPKAREQYCYRNGKLVFLGFPQQSGNGNPTLTFVMLMIKGIMGTLIYFEK